MEQCDKERMDNERKKLQDIKWMTLKVAKEKETIEELFAAEEILNTRKASELKELALTLERKLHELQTEIEITEMRMETKMKEVESLIEYKEKDSNFGGTYEDYWKKYNEMVAELEAEVKREYLEYQNERDIKMLLETVREKLSEENKRPVLMEILRRKKDYALKRGEDFEKRKEILAGEVNAMSEEIEKLKKKINILEQRYQSLLDLYAMSKRAKETAQVMRSSPYA